MVDTKLAGFRCGASGTQVKTFEDSCVGAPSSVIAVSTTESAQEWAQNSANTGFCYDCGSFLVATSDPKGVDCGSLASDPPTCPNTIESLYARIANTDGKTVIITEINCEAGDLQSSTQEETVCSEVYRVEFPFANVCRGPDGRFLSLCAAENTNCEGMGLVSLGAPSQPPPRQVFFESLCEAIGPEVGAAVEESRCINSTHMSTFPYGCENGEPTTLFENEPEVVGTEWTGRVVSIVDFYEEMSGERNEAVQYCHECGSLVAFSSSPSIDCSIRDDDPPVCPSSAQYLELSHSTKFNTTHETYSNVICTSGQLEFTKETGAWCNESFDTLPYLNICRIPDGREVRLCLSSYKACSEMGFEEVGNLLPPKPSSSVSLPPPEESPAPTSSIAAVCNCWMISLLSLIYLISLQTS